MRDDDCDLSIYSHFPSLEHDVCFFYLSRRYSVPWYEKFWVYVLQIPLERLALQLPSKFFARRYVTVITLCQIKSCLLYNIKIVKYTFGVNFMYNLLIIIS